MPILHGIHGVPLLYVTWEAEELGAHEEYKTFTKECIAKCPLESPKFEADSKTVHQIIVLYTASESFKT